MADEATASDAVPEKSGGMGKMLMFGGIGLALLVVGIFVGPMVKNMMSPPPAEEPAEVTEPGSGPAFYTSLHPPLVVNFTDELGESHVMQVTLEVMAPSQAQINQVREHIPVIRNSLILLLGSAVYEEVVTREGKETLLAKCLEEIRAVMTEKIGEPAVEAVYFTGLVIQ